MDLPLTFDALIDVANASNLYDKLVFQIKKDFSLANVELDIAENITPEDLKISLHEMLYYLIQEKFSDFLNLLYIVDISENKMRQLDGTDILKLSELVALMVFKREWKKVWYRHNYSGNT